MEGIEAPPRRASAWLVLLVMGAISVLMTTATVGLAVLRGEPQEEAAPTVALTAGETFEGRIGGLVPRPVAYTFDGAVGQRVTVTMNRIGDGLDPYLRLQRPDGTLLAENDDSGGDLDSRIDATLDMDGTWTVEASGLGDSRGAFRLAFELSDPRAG